MSNETCNVTCEYKGQYVFHARRHPTYRYPHPETHRVQATVLPTSTCPEAAGSQNLFAILTDAETGDPLWNGIQSSPDPIIAICRAAHEYGFDIQSDIKEIS